MQRYAAKISFLGTPFHGWQRQENAHTIQGQIEKALSTLAKQSIAVVGCGRTDTGVHAKDYILHFDFPPEASQIDLPYKLNALLPTEIAVHAIQEVNLDFHARYDATQRTYEYWCHVGKNPFLKGLSMELFRELDLEAMNKAAAFLLGEKDFTSFAKLHGSAKHNYCQVFSAGWELNSGVYVFTISANRFLRNMVRATVGTLFQIGLGKEDPDHVNLVLQQKNRGAAGESVKACGLYLTDIKYPNLEWQRQ